LTRPRVRSDCRSRTDWKPAIAANLRVTLAFAEAVEAFPLPDDTEPAPVFKA
jgi:hypothetical protein